MWEQHRDFVAALDELAGNEADGVDVPVDGVGAHYYEGLLHCGHDALELDQ